MTWTCCAPAPTSTCCWVRIPGPAPATPTGTGRWPGRPRRSGGPGRPTGGPRPSPVPAGGAVPAGFAGRVTLTAPLATLPDLADRPGELACLGPIDPWLARDLAAAAARNPEDDLVRHRDRRARPRHRARLRPTRTHAATRHTAPDPGRPGGGFTFTPASRDGPPGRYGTWILAPPVDSPDLRVTLDPIDTGPCDHRLPIHGARPRRHAAAPDPGPARHLHQPHLPAARYPMRLRAQCAVRGGRTGAVCVMAARSAGMTTGSNSTRNGQSTSSPTAPSAGPPRPGAPTPPNPPGTPSEGPRVPPGLSRRARGGAGSCR